MSKHFRQFDYYSEETLAQIDAEFARYFRLNRRTTTPTEAAHIANVTVREHFNHDHFRRVMEARNWINGE